MRGGSTRKRCLFLSSQYILKKVGKISILVFERVTKSASSRTNDGLSEVYQRVLHFGGNDYATESERREKRGDYRKFYCFALS